MRSNNHGKNHDENVHEDRDISEPSKFLQCSDLTKKHACDDKDDNTDDVTELELGNDRKSQSVRDRDQGNGQNQLDRLEDVDWNASGLAVTE